MTGVAAQADRRRSVVVMFSGQGSQYYQMGRGLWEGHAVFRDWMLRADAWVRAKTGRSLVDEIYSPAKAKGDVFNELAITHPAIFAVEYAMFQTLRHAGLQPDMLFGASLGETAAAAAAGAIGFEQALGLICEQAACLEELCPNSGGLIAILAPRDLYETEPLLRTTTTLAGVNFANHFIVSAATDRLEPVERQLRELGVTFQRLAVTQGFHSAQIEPIAQRYGAVLARQTISPPAIPLVFCSCGGPITTLDARALWTTVRGPIRFHETIQALERTGPCWYVDAGPSGTLATLAKYNLAPGSKSLTAPILNPYGRDVENLEKVLASGRAPVTGGRP